MTIQDMEVEVPLDTPEYKIDLGKLGTSESDPNPDSPLLPLIEERIHYAASVVTGSFLKNKADVAIFFGTMAGGKTTTLFEVIDNMEQTFLIQDENLSDVQKRKVHYFKKNGVDRDINSTSTVVARSADGSLVSKEAIGIPDASSIIEKITRKEIRCGDMVAVSELQFLDNETEVTKLLNVCRDNGIKFAADCLGAWFNTEPVSHVNAVLDSIDIEEADRIIAVPFQAYDTYAPDKLAEMTFRGVGVQVNLDNGEILDEIVHHQLKQNGAGPERVYDAKYYIENPNIDIRKVAAGMFELFGDKVLIRDDMGLPPHIVIPAHPDDEPEAVGLKRYQPMSIELYLRLCKEVAGMHDVDDFVLTPITAAYNHPSIMNFPDHLLPKY